MKHMRVAVTGGAGQIAYSLLFRVASGELFGSECRITLHILDVEQASDKLLGTVMELEDCAFPLLEGIVYGCDPMKVFKDIDLALLVGAKPRGAGMERGDLLTANSKIFIDQARALDTVANPQAKVLVVGNPCNSNAWVIQAQVRRLKAENIHALTRLDQNRGRGLLAKKAQVRIEEVSPLIIWGNHSATQVPDPSHTTIGGLPAEEAVTSDWLEKEWLPRVQKRGSEVIEVRGSSSAASAASAIIDAAKDLMHPSPAGYFYSSGMISDGNGYGISSGLIYSFPCRTLADGTIERIEGFSCSAETLRRMKLSEKELLAERSMVEGVMAGFDQ